MEVRTLAFEVLLPPTRSEEPIIGPGGGATPPSARLPSRPR